MTVSAVISSICYGLIAGGIGALAVAAISWIFNYNNFWLTIGLGIGIAAVCAVVIFFIKLRPTSNQVIARVDSMGLDERAVTMAELEGSDTCIARLQRTDAVAKIKGVTPAQIKSAFPIYALNVPSTIATCVAILAGAGMTVVQGLTGAGIISSPGIVPDEREQFITVSYLVEEGGSIMGGPEDQILLPGENAEPVTAEADDGWVFVRWSDGNKNPGRADANITADLNVTAIFEEIGEGGDGEYGDGENPGNDDEGDYDQSAPNPNDSEGPGTDGEGGDGGEGDGSGSEGDGSGTGQGGQEGQGNGQGQGEGAGGGWSDGDLILDGETPYRDVLEQYIEAMKQQIANGTLPPELVEFIEDCFGSL